MNKIKALLIIFSTLIFTCESEEYEFGDISTPTNLLISVEVQGADEDNPNGDGSGFVTFTATADNAISYTFKHNGINYSTPGGVFNHRFTNLGTFTYNLEVTASGTAGVMTNSSILVDVLYTFEPPAELLESLTTGVWRIKAEDEGHVGVHLASSFHDGINSFPVWYSASPYDKIDTGMYDDRLIFLSDGTMEYETSGAILGKKTAIDDAYPNNNPYEADDVDNDEYFYYPAEPFISNWSISESDGYLVINLTGNGFTGFFVGGNSYSIMYRSSTEMYLKTIGFDNNAWYTKLTNEN